MLAFPHAGPIIRPFVAFSELMQLGRFTQNLWRHDECNDSVNNVWFYRECQIPIEPVRHPRIPRDKEPAESLVRRVSANHIVSGLRGKFMPQKFLRFCHFRIPFGELLWCQEIH